MPKSNLATRFLTAFVAGPILLALLYLGPAWGWFAFLCVAAVLGAFELFGMTHPDDAAMRPIGAALTVAVMNALWFWTTEPRGLLTLVVVAPTVGMFVTLFRLGDIRTAALRAFAATFGPLYLGGGLAALALLRRDAGGDGASFVLLSMMLSWLSDTGAYFAGRFFGKHKLYEAVSPKKTVEGAAGGLAGSIAGALLAHFFYLRSLPIPDAIGLAVVGGAAGQAGDLGESMLKRSAGVKDSGGIVPGHGGILDRVDALLVAGIVTYLYVLWFRG